MCQTPNCSIVRRAIDLNYAKKQRAASLKWLLVNGALLAVLTYDLWSWCGGCGAGAGGLAWAEALGALVLAANCVQHVARLARFAPHPQPLSPHQQRLLGLKETDRVADSSVAPRAVPGPGAEPGSLSPRRSWRAPPPPTPPSPPSPPPPSPPHPRADPDEFISDPRALAAYISAAEARAADAAGCGSGCGPSCGPSCGRGSAARSLAPARAHQLAVLPERSPETLEQEAGGAPLWRRLRVDPQRLTEYNLNLRLWLHATVVGRVARELAAGASAALLPFLAPFADKQYVAGRIAELSRGGCLSAYRWDGGGRGWRAESGRPTDAELLLHLFSAYLQLLAPAGAARALPLRRAARHPPHYVLLLDGEALEVGAGRNNLLHALLLLLAAAARRDPPALCRLHLGPAGLNVLWVLGR